LAPAPQHQPKYFSIADASEEIDVVFLAVPASDLTSMIRGYGFIRCGINQGIAYPKHDIRRGISVLPDFNPRKILRGIYAGRTDGRNAKLDQ
jgi:hypothetical protein